MSTVMTPEQFHTWSHHLQLTSETEALITAIRSSVCQFCHRLIWGHLRPDHRDGLAVWASGQGIHHCPHLACCSTSAALQEKPGWAWRSQSASLPRMFPNFGSPIKKVIWQTYRWEPGSSPWEMGLSGASTRSSNRILPSWSLRVFS